MRVYTSTLVLTLVLAATPAAAAGPGGVHRLTEAADGVWVAHPRFGGANAVVVLDPAGVLVVDPHSSPAAARALVEEIRALTDVPVRWVVNTHWHNDHHGGNRALVAAFPGVQLIAHAQTRTDIPTLAAAQLRGVGTFYETFLTRARARLDAGADDEGAPLTAAARAQIERYLVDERAYIDGIGRHAFTLPDVTIDGPLELHLASQRVRVVPLTGHTAGDLVVHLPDRGLAAVGDLLTAPIIVTHSSFPAQWGRSLRALDGLGADRLIVGHGGPVKDRAFARTMAALLEAVVAEVASARAAGASAEEALARVRGAERVRAFEARIAWQEPGIDFLDFERFLAMTVPRAYAEGS